MLFFAVVITDKLENFLSPIDSQLHTSTEKSAGKKMHSVAWKSDSYLTHTSRPFVSKGIFQRERETLNFFVFLFDIERKRCQSISELKVQ